jgi:hypothetical protein
MRGSSRRSPTGFPAASDGISQPRRHPASAHRGAEAAHHEHEKRTGRPHLFRHSGQDENWPAWYAYLVAEQARTDLTA